MKFLVVEQKSEVDSSVPNEPISKDPTHEVSTEEISTKIEKIDNEDHVVKTRFFGYFISAFIHLFFQRKFAKHRMMGLCFLIQYAATFCLYLYDYQMFLRSPLIITLPLTGVCQTLTAIYTFTFLPKNPQDPGYFGDKGTISYAFVKENLFFSLILAFQWLYYNDDLYPYFKKYYVVEYLFVFLPYVFRFLSSKTRMRDSLNNLKNKTEKNQFFLFYLTWTTKIFYVWAKHYIGFFLNYLRFQGKATAYDQKAIYALLIAASFATTISLFLHTLKFRGYISARTSLGTYVASYMFTFIGYGMVFYVFFQHSTLFFITLAGLIINLLDVNAFNVYQIAVMAAFHYNYVV